MVSADSLYKKYLHANVLAQQQGYLVAQMQQGGCKGHQSLPFVRDLGQGVFIYSINHKNKLDGQGCMIRWAPANDDWKLSPQLEQELPSLRNQGNTALRFTITATDIRDLFNESFDANGSIKLIWVNSETQSAVVQCSLQWLINRLLPSNLLLFADVHHNAQTEVLLTGFDKGNNGMNTMAYRLPFANGRGVVTGIKERMMRSLDIDLQQRVEPSILADAELEFHATSIATMIGGAGNSFYTGRGIAPQCRFFPSSFANIFPDSSNLLLQRNIYIQNHSYGTVKQQFYGAEAAAYDVQTAANKQLLHVFSSGNKGTEAGPAGIYNGVAGFANMTGNFKMAKNVLTVAAIDTSGGLATFSSAGPLHDGRLGPQLAAFGLNGTSDAAALVSGTATVLHQVYKDSNAQAVPPAALVKAILYNTADDLSAPGIDYRSGFGAINVYEAVLTMLKKQFATSAAQQNSTWTYTLNLPAQAANLKITLAWTDTAASINNSRALINDLDLELVELSTGTLYKPWVLNPAPHVDSLNQLPQRKRDTLNTAEQITIALPNPGQYQITVKGTRVQTLQAQPFHVAWGWDTLNRLVFTSPNQAEDISLEERNTLMVKWKTALANPTATGTLSIRYGVGAAWQTIAANLPLNSKQYKWLVKDTVAVAQLRIECPFGVFFSPDFVLAPFTKLKVDYVCSDSAGISWQRNPMASAYQLLALPNDTAYLKPIALLADTSVTLRNAQLQYEVFAVRPVLANGLPAAQSLALNIRDQAVGCFYNSFGAVNNGTTVNLELLLSTTNGVDSVVFEKLNNNNSLLRILGARLVNGTSPLFALTDDAPRAGLNFYRVRIVFKDRRFVYTNIVSVINTGQKQIFLYPNPVTAARVLYYQLKDGNPGWQLQLIDMQGRVVRTQTINFAGSIRMANLQPGIYCYRLANAAGAIAETGKIIVTN